MRRSAARREAERGHMEEQRNEMDALHPMLNDAHERLEDALDEACEAKPASQETTGEMIRLEETLSVAAEAAKRAVSIRRRLREETDRARRDLPAAGDADADDREGPGPPRAD